MFYRSRKVWESLYPPAIITALQVLWYGLAIWLGVQTVLNSPIKGDIITWYSALCLMVGGFAAAVMAWRGNYQLEGPLALVVIMGSFLTALVAIPLVGESEHFPRIIIMSLMIGVSSTERCITIWRRGDPTFIAKARADRAREEYETLG